MTSLKKALGAAALALVMAGCSESGTRSQSDKNFEAVTATEITPDEAATSAGGRPVRHRRRATRDDYGISSPASGRPRGAPEPTTISGTIRLAGGGGAADVAVSLWTYSSDDKTSLPWRRVAEAKTDRAGAYRIAGPLQSAWNLTARKTGFAVAAATAGTENFDAVHPRDVPYTNLVLGPELPLSGRIINHEGTPVADAHVIADAVDKDGIYATELQTYSDADGHFSLAGVPEGGVKIAAKAPDHPIEFFSAAAPDDALEIKLSGKAPMIDGHLICADFDLSRNTTSITLEGETEISGLNINYQTVANLNSRFNFGAVSARDYSIFLSGNPVNVFPETSSTRNGRPYIWLSAKDGVSTTTEIKVTIGVTLRGQVVDAETSAPLAGVRLYPDSKSMERKQRFVETTATGSFELPGVSRANSVQIDSDSHYLLSPVTKHGVFDAPTSGVVAIVMLRSPFIRGIVEGDTGTPVAGATLNLSESKSWFDAGKDVPVDPGGYFQAQARRGKNYTIEAQAPGYAPSAIEDIKVGDEDINDLRLRLGRGRSVSGIVVDPAGKPVYGAAINATAPDDRFGGMIMVDSGSDSSWRGKEFSVSVTDAHGRFQLEHLPVHTDILISAEAASFAHPAYHTIKKSENDLSDIRLELPATVELRGVIVDQDGEPVKGATVGAGANLAQLHFRAKTVSSTSGTFVIKAFPQTPTVTIIVSHASYNDFRKVISVSDQPVSVTLIRVENLKLEVRCIDVISRKPVPAALTAIDMSTQGKPVANPVPDRPGVFEVTGLAMGNQYVFLPRADGYMESTFRQQLTTDTVNGIDLALRAAGVIRGRVINAVTRNPVAGATIASNYRSDEVITTTDAEGRFEMTAESSSKEFVARHKDGGVSSPFVAQGAAGDAVDIGDIELFSKVPLTVRVVEGESARPVPDAHVEVTTRIRFSNGEKMAGKTDQQGEFKTTTFPSAAIGVKLPEWDFSRDIEAYSSSDANRVVVCHVGGGEFRGRILLDEKPVAGTVRGKHLNVSDSSVEFRAGSDGKFLFENLAPGSWRFTASSQSFGTSSGHVDAQITPDGDPVERDILLSSRRLGGRVINEAGKPVADATVDLRYTDGRGNYGAVSDESGRFEFSMPVPPATYKVQATHATKGRTLFLPFQMPETGQPPALNLTLVSTPAQITCTVLSILDGLPVSRASAELRSGSEMVASAGNTFNSGQDVVIFDVQPGDYQLVVTASGYSEVSHSITVEPGQSQSFTDVLSPAAEVTVQLVDKNGYSISRAAVTITPAQSDIIQPPQSSATDETGIAKFAGVLYGTYQVQAITPTGAAASGMLSTQNQKSTRFRLQVD